MTPDSGDPFDLVMGRRRGTSDTPAEQMDQDTFAARARMLADRVTLLGARPEDVNREAALLDIRIVGGWFVGARSQAPVFLLSDNRRHAGRDPDGVLLTWLADGIDGRKASEEDLIERALVFLYEAVLPRP